MPAGDPQPRHGLVDPKSHSAVGRCPPGALPPAEGDSSAVAPEDGLTTRLAAVAGEELAAWAEGMFTASAVRGTRRSPRTRADGVTTAAVPVRASFCHPGWVPRSTHRADRS